MGGEDTDLLCVEVSALGAPPTLPRVAFGVWQELPPACTMSSTEQTHEDFLKSLLLKTDVYRPVQRHLRFMEDASEIRYTYREWRLETDDGWDEVVGQIAVICSSSTYEALGLWLWPMAMAYG